MNPTSIIFKGGELAEVTYALEKRIEELARESKVSGNKKESRDYGVAAKRLRELLRDIRAQMEPDKRKSKLKASAKAGRRASLGDFLLWASGRYDLWYMEGGITRNHGDDGWQFQWNGLPGGIADSEILKAIPSRKYKTG